MTENTEAKVESTETKPTRHQPAAVQPIVDDAVAKRKDEREASKAREKNAVKRTEREQKGDNKPEPLSGVEPADMG